MNAIKSTTGWIRGAAALAVGAVLACSCIRDHVPEKIGGSVLFDYEKGYSSPGSANVWVYDVAGDVIYRGSSSSPESGIAIDGLYRGERYRVGALSGVGVPDLPVTSYKTLDDVSFWVNAESVAAWKASGSWPCVSSWSESGTREYLLPIEGEDAGFFRMKMRGCGFPVSIRIDASQIVGWGVQIEDIWMDAPEGEYHPFTGKFLAGVRSAPQRPSSEEQAALQSNLTRMRSAAACTFHVFESPKVSAAVVRTLLSFRNLTTGVTIKGGWEFNVDESTPSGYDPANGALEAILLFHEDGQSIGGTWSFKSVSR